MKKAATDLNWRLLHEEDDSKALQKSNVIWIDTGNVNDIFCNIKPWQSINHFPGIQHIARKTLMAYQLGVMQRKFKVDYAFYPKTFILPRDIAKLKAKSRFPFGRSKIAYIIKPDGGSRGRGIFLTKDLKDIEALGTSHIAQHYISNPLLIEQKKFDLRLYVLITSCFPLRIYIFRNGLVRLCTREYENVAESNMSDCCMHLTNYAVNRKSDSFEKPSKDDASGCFGSKRSVEWFLSWLSNNHGAGASDDLWRGIGHITVKTIISVIPILTNEYHSLFGDCASTENNIGEPELQSSRCFSILGFDILVDDKLKPYVIEVNHLSSFGTDSELDERIKYEVVYQALSVQKPLNRDQVNCNKVKGDDISQHKDLRLKRVDTKYAKSIARRATEAVARLPSSTSFHRSNKKLSPRCLTNNLVKHDKNHHGGARIRISAKALGCSDSSAPAYQSKKVDIKSIGDNVAEDRKGHELRSSEQSYSGDIECFINNIAEDSKGHELRNIDPNNLDIEFQKLVTFGGYERLYPPSPDKENPPYDQMIDFIYEHFTKLYQYKSPKETVHELLPSERDTNKVSRGEGRSAVKYPLKTRKSAIFDRLSRGLSARVIPSEHPFNAMGSTHIEKNQPARKKHGDNIINKRPFPMAPFTLELYN